MAAETQPESNENGGNRSVIVGAAVAAAATGAAAYGVRRLRSGRDEDEGEAADESGEAEETDDGDEERRGGVQGKREELTQALATKVSDAKGAASRLKPGGGGRRSMVDTAWEAASEQLRPVAGEAAASLGATVAKKAPEVVREELMPRFIEGFEKAS